MGKAAKRLNVSQPAISKAVVELKDALGVRLLDRGRRGVVPTAYGLALAKHSMTIFNDLRQGIQAIDFLSDPTRGEVRIGTTESIATAIVLPAIDKLSRKYPQLCFDVVPGDTASLYKLATVARGGPCPFARKASAITEPKKLSNGSQRPRLACEIGKREFTPPRQRIFCRRDYRKSIVKQHLRGKFVGHVCLSKYKTSFSRRAAFSPSCRDSC